MTAPHVFEVTTANFAAEVVERSAQVPVLLDFWAEWCGPCKTLTPVLEALAADYGGSFVLGKVDTEANQELAAAFQVRGIPFVVLFAGGRPVDAFQGALPDREVRAFLARSGIEPQAAVEAAAEHAEGEATTLAAAKRALRSGDVAEARRLLGDIEDEADQAAERDRLLDGLGWLDADLTAATPAVQALARARQAFGGGDLATAMAELLASMEADRGYGDGMARRAMLLCFAYAGDDSDEVSAARRRMATLLY